MRLGGFPEYLKAPFEEILANLLDDILIRDISVRYGIKDTRGLKRLMVYLLSNIGNLTSANKLKEPSGISSTTTILEYISHLEQSYLINLVPMFDYSLKMVYNALRLKYKEIYYHKGKGECDFITIEKGAITQAIQVCLKLDIDNQTREFNGLIDAMKTYHLNEGYIVTLNQEDVFQIEDLTIKVVSSYNFL